MDMSSRQLFVDLDGVLADFDGFIAQEFGIVNNRENERPDFWDVVSQYKGRLYYDMKPLPGAAALWEALLRYNPIILSGCPTSIPTAAEDKRQWVWEYIDQEAEIITCKSKDKSKYGLPGDVLLDDWKKYQHLWEAVGGIFLHHVNNDRSIGLVEGVMNGKT